MEDIKNHSDGLYCYIGGEFNPFLMLFFENKKELINSYIKSFKELFNDNVGKIIFLILFFYPIFQGHMGLNSKDTIIALCHVWIFYFFIKYIKKQYIKGKSNNYINYIAVLSATGTGINLFFLGSLNWINWVRFEKTIF